MRLKDLKKGMRVRVVRVSPESECKPEKNHFVGNVYTISNVPGGGRWPIQLQGTGYGWRPEEIGPVKREIRNGELF